jgi:hypothetical protein
MEPNIADVSSTKNAAPSTAPKAIHQLLHELRAKKHAKRREDVKAGPGPATQRNTEELTKKRKAADEVDNAKVTKQRKGPQDSVGEEEKAAKVKKVKGKGTRKGDEEDEEEEYVSDEEEEKGKNIKKGKGKGKGKGKEKEKGNGEAKAKAKGRGAAEEPKVDTKGKAKAKVEDPTPSSSKNTKANAKKVQPTHPPMSIGELEGLDAFLSALEKLVEVNHAIAAGLRSVREQFEAGVEFEPEDSGSESSGGSTVDGEMLKQELAGLVEEKDMYDAWCLSINGDLEDLEEEEVAMSMEV